MKTIIDVLIVDNHANAGYMQLKKEFDILIPCYPGMLVRDPVLRSNDSPLEVQSVMLEMPHSTEDGPIIYIHLKNRDAKNKDIAKEDAEMFKAHGWHGFGEST